MPPGVVSISVNVAGGKGGDGQGTVRINDQPVQVTYAGGPGQIVTASVPVTPGDVLDVYVGQNGGSEGSGGSVSSGSPCVRGGAGGVDSGPDGGSCSAIVSNALGTLFIAGGGASGPGVEPADWSGGGASDEYSCSCSVTRAG